MTILEQFQNLEREARASLSRAATAEELEAFRILFLARRGKVSVFLRGLKVIPLEDRRTVGKRANDLREDLMRGTGEKKRQLRGAAKQRIDVTIPGRRLPRGNLHPLTIVRREIEDLFLGMGFEILETPEVEEARYNFDLVNIPLGHPARDLMDTFWLTDGRLLRTHTYAGQARVMTGRTPPFRILIPGRVFRHEATDASHEATFYQFEGLFVGEQVSLADFKGVVTEALPKILRHDVRIRLRPSYFPFVEPGVEVDVSCFLCATGCSVCQGTRWIEVMGAGMVHPVVLKNVGIDPKKYRGFAFGGSIDRVAMLRYGINDIRLFWSGDPHFLKQF
jgi:phenylalanyl-tRNA synthetase alpha chain